MSTRSTPQALLKALATLVGYWAPVWIPLAFLAQVGLLGLRPALTERARLDHEEVRVRARHEAAREHFTELDAEVSAWADPIYRERLRRAAR